MNDKIYLISRIKRDADNYVYFEAAPDYGYFMSQGAAEGEVNRLCVEAGSEDYTYEEVDRNRRDMEEE